MHSVRLFLPVIVLISIASVAFAQNQEVTLFDKRGKALAYIASDEDMTIYLWTGEPVAYLLHKGERYLILGFNGKHIGWYDDGFIDDHHGDVVGFSEGRLRMNTEMEPLKSLKQNKPFKARIKEPQTKPGFTNTWAAVALSVFLNAGIEK